MYENEKILPNPWFFLELTKTIPMFMADGTGLKRKEFKKDFA